MERNERGKRILCSLFLSLMQKLNFLGARKNEKPKSSIFAPGMIHTTVVSTGTPLNSMRDVMCGGLICLFDPIPLRSTIQFTINFSAQCNRENKISVKNLPTTTHNFATKTKDGVWVIESQVTSP
jgi:hypothetical protein